MSLSSSIRKNVIFPLWLLKDRSPRLSYMNEMEKSQYYSYEVLRKQQLTKFKDIIKHAYENTEYYRKKFDEVGIHPNDIVSHKDITEIPFLTKKDIQEKTETLITRSSKKKDLYPFKTGGSTGKAVTVFCDFKAIEKGIGAALRSFRWTGWDIGEPSGSAWGNPPPKNTIKEKLKNALLEPQIFLDTMKLNNKTMFEFIDKWNKTKPTLLHGHSHSLFIFSKFCKKYKIDDIRPEGIISVSMMLMPGERKSIEDVFQCKVTDLYGCEEVGLIACECKNHNGMHINMENVYVEFVGPNGDEVSLGEEGAIVVTSLLNKSMPLIRYKIEDVGIPSEKKCSCGRNLPLLDGIIGRVADFLVRKDGSLVAGVSLVERTLTAISGIEQMQIVQEDVENISVNLVKGDMFDEDKEKALIQELKNSLGDDVNIAICIKDKIHPEPSGKYRFSISKVKNIYEEG